MFLHFIRLLQAVLVIIALRDYSFLELKINFSLLWHPAWPRIEWFSAILSQIFFREE